MESTQMRRVIMASQEGIQGMILQVTTTGHHTISETVSIEVVSKMLELLKVMYVDI